MLTVSRSLFLVKIVLVCENGICDVRYKNIFCGILDRLF